MERTESSMEPDGTGEGCRPDAGPDGTTVAPPAPGSDGAVAAPREKRSRLVVWLPLAVIALDQATKAMVRTWIPVHESRPVIMGWLDFTHVQNTGAAFGVFNTIDFPFKPVVLALVAAVALTGIAVYAARVPAAQWVARAGLALIVGGAAGNLIDRVTAGFVLDFVDVYVRGWHFWAFNVADAAITCGVTLMIVDLLGLGSHVPTTA